MMQTLKQIVAKQIDQRWNVWAKAHPHLAAAIDRTQLVDATVERLRDDPRFIAAMQQAAVDEKTLGAAAGVLGKAEQLIGQWLPLS